MGFLSGKRILIAGLASNRSIAYGVAEAMRREGAELAFTYQNDRLKDRVVKLGQAMGATVFLPCDVSSDDAIDQLFNDLNRHWGDGMDGLVHAIAFAPREALEGRFIDSVNRENFHIAHDISAYSFAAMAKRAAPMMAGRRGSMVTMSYLGAMRWMPHYNVMALAKASLEATVRYLAADLGPDNIRVNGISAGAIRTLAASGIKGFRNLLDYAEQNSPMRRNVTIEDVGNTAAFLAADLAAGITGQILYVDAGFSTGGFDISRLAEPAASDR